MLVILFSLLLSETICSFYLGRFQRCGVLKNVKLFGPPCTTNKITKLKKIKNKNNAQLGITIATEHISRLSERLYAKISKSIIPLCAIINNTRYTTFEFYSEI